MTTNINIDNTPITTLDYKGIKGGYDAHINSVILASIDDLGYDALSDDGTLWWIDLTDLTTNVLRHAIEAMPLKKNGTPDARPAMRRIMESLDARENMTDVVVQFDHVELDNVADPTDDELLDLELENDLENMTW
jgi:hypothetical protein